MVKANTLVRSDPLSVHWHLCFECPLPECNDEDPACLIFGVNGACPDRRSMDGHLKADSAKRSGYDRGYYLRNRMAINTLNRKRYSVRRRKIRQQQAHYRALHREEMLAATRAWKLRRKSKGDA